MTEESTADVEPAGLRLVDGYTYLDAWSRPRQAWRSFRLDRIVSVEVLPETFEPRGEPTTGWFDDVPRRLGVTVTRQAAWIVEYYPTSEVVNHGDRLEVTFPVASEEWAVGLLLRLGDQLLAVSDPALRETARVRAAAALAHYRARVK
ncbi:WYL domain-containing protein [Tessaracoccus sp. HDW20]|uniref:helix-turn-helix transcriptional regulator n=1 Tax=Tessaracoccus coleopterorum TaxID=2714950 RepID=UPI0018D440CE|nr:WYL domain-containing protein [Tessaracoccus coleopterorum]NHB85856.1 WYL domain-containing protein [Tessaracoccus coleopterorum]